MTDSKKPLNRLEAAHVFEALNVMVQRYTKAFHPHPQSFFLGYLDLTLIINIEGVSEGFPSRVRGFGVKILKGKPYVECPTDAVEKDGKISHVPGWFPESAEARAALTARIFELSIVKDWMKEAEEILAKGAADCGTQADSGAPTAAFSANNPFA